MATYIYLPASKLTHAGKPGSRGRSLTHGDTFEADFEGVADVIKGINGRIPGEGGKPAIRKVAPPKPAKTAK